MNFIGSGVVFHVPSFFKELKELDDLGLPGVYDRILVSDRVHIDLDLHAAVDGLEEVELGEGKIGTTGRGIGPSYSCKAARSGIRMAEVFDAELFESKLRRLASGYAKRYGDLLKYDVEEELARFNEYRPKLAKYAVDGVSLLQSAQKNNTKILVEGANALMLDLDMGSYPYVTSSTTSIAGIIGGLALNPRGLTEVIGVVKAYTTRNGMGSFKTEDLGEVGTKLQDVGREWGTSTGRKRRCGCLMFSTPSRRSRSPLRTRIPRPARSWLHTLQISTSSTALRLSTTRCPDGTSRPLTRRPTTISPRRHEITSIISRISSESRSSGLAPAPTVKLWLSDFKRPLVGWVRSG